LQLNSFSIKRPHYLICIATRSGISFGINDMEIPAEKSQILSEAEKEVIEIQSQYASGMC
jgi:DNA-directed RNA polymerase subunit beta'